MKTSVWLNECINIEIDGEWVIIYNLFIWHISVSFYFFSPSSIHLLLSSILAKFSLWFVKLKMYSTKAAFFAALGLGKFNSSLDYQYEEMKKKNPPKTLKKHL